MNKIYKVIKNHSTGCITVVSELAKGAKKGSKLKLTSLLVFSVLSTHVYAVDYGLPQGYDPSINNNKTGSITISGSGSVIDLAIDNGLSSAQKGEEVKKHTITTEDTVSALYKTKYTDVKNATNNFNQIQNAFNNGIATQDDLDNAQNALQQAQEKAAAISDTKFSVNDSNGLIGSNSAVTIITDKEINYTDPVTGKAFQLTVVDKLVTQQAGTGIIGDGFSVDFYEKTPTDDQYHDMELVVINGSGTDVTIKNSDEGNKDTLTAISKENTGVIKVNDGADLTFATDVSYYTGNGKSVSHAFEPPTDDIYAKGGTTTLYEVRYKGNISTVLGERSLILAKKVDRCLLYDISKHHRRKISWSKNLALSSNNNQWIMPYPMLTFPSLKSLII